MLAATIVNIILDYLFIFVFKWGLFSAAIATDIGEFVGAAIMLIYLFGRSRLVTVKFVWLKMSIKSLLLTLRCSGLQCYLLPVPDHFHGIQRDSTIGTAYYQL